MAAQQERGCRYFFEVQEAKLLQASAEMERVLDTKPLETSEGRGWSRLKAYRWRHGEFHDRTASMREHVVMAYLRAGGRIDRRTSGRSTTGRMRAGAVTIIPSGQEAFWDLEGSVEIVHAYVYPGILQTFADEHDVRVGPLRERLAFDDATAARLLELLASELRCTGERDTLFIDQLCGLVCMHLLRSHSEPLTSHVGGIRGGLAPWQASRVVEMVLSSLERTHSLDELAKAVGLSPFHFARSFKTTIGLAPHAWVLQQRIGRARQLLTQTVLPVGEIAASVGYADPSYFARLFRKAVGESPAKYRQQTRN